MLSNSHSSQKVLDAYELFEQNLGNMDCYPEIVERSKTFHAQYVAPQPMYVWQISLFVQISVYKLSIRADHEVYPSQ